MEKPLRKGDVIVLPFPFIDLSSSKKRPAFITSILPDESVILCSILSLKKDKFGIELKDQDFNKGRINHISYIRPNRIFTADKKIINYKIGSLKKEKTDFIIRKIIQIIKN